MGEKGRTADYHLAPPVTIIRIALEYQESTSTEE